MKALHGIRMWDNRIEIGAATTFAELTQDALIEKELPVLYEAAAHVGSPQIRARGTVGGNVANAYTIGVLLALERGWKRRVCAVYGECR